MNTTAFKRNWKPATGEKPEVNQVVLLKRKGDDKERFALWNGTDYYIFDLQRGEWMKSYEYFAWVANHETPAPLEDFEYSTVPQDAYKHLAFFAIAEARRNRIDSGAHFYI